MIFCGSGPSFCPPVHRTRQDAACLKIWNAHNCSASKSDTSRLEARGHGTETSNDPNQERQARRNLVHQLNESDQLKESDQKRRPPKGLTTRTLPKEQRRPGTACSSKPWLLPT